LNFIGIQNKDNYYLEPTNGVKLSKYSICNRVIQTPSLAIHNNSDSSSCNLCFTDNSSDTIKCNLNKKGELVEGRNVSKCVGIIINI